MNRNFFSSGQHHDDARRNAAGMMRISAVRMAIVIVVFIIAHSWAQGQDDIVPLNREFFSDFQKQDPIKRDAYLEKNLNRLFAGKGYIEAVEKISGGSFGFRIVLKDIDALNLNIRYNLFTNNQRLYKELAKNALFEFRGRLIVYTPISSKRDAYILDIVLLDSDPARK